MERQCGMCLGAEGKAEAVAGIQDGTVSPA